MGMTFIHFKYIAALLILLITLISAWYPFKARLTSVTENEFPIGQALAAGVFLGAGLLHMLTDANIRFLDQGIRYPLAALLAGITFLLLLLLEHIGMTLQHHADGVEKLLAILAMIMLSLHSVLAGLALGVTLDYSHASIILFAIVAHKWADSFALAVQVNRSSFRLTQRLFLFSIFAIMTPMGIWLGSHVGAVSFSYPLLSPILAALAAGTFIYIGTLHGLHRAVLIKHCCNLREFSFMIFGFSIMALVAIWI